MSDLCPTPWLIRGSLLSSGGGCLTFSSCPAPFFLPQKGVWLSILLAVGEAEALVGISVLLYHKHGKEKTSRERVESRHFTQTPVEIKAGTHRISITSVSRTVLQDRTYSLSGTRGSVQHCISLRREKQQVQRRWQGQIRQIISVIGKVCSYKTSPWSNTFLATMKVTIRSVSCSEQKYS